MIFSCVSGPIAWAAVSLLAVAVAWGLVYFWRILPAGLGYKAKVLCSALFVSGRGLKDVLSEDVRVDNYWMLRLFKTDVDWNNKTVTASFLGLRSSTAAYRPGLGATLAIGIDSAALTPRALGRPLKTLKTPAWSITPGTDALQRVVADAFTEPDPKKLRRTRAVLVVRDGNIIAERYAPRFGPDFPLCSWSMTKSFIGALVGVLVGEGRLALDRKSLLPEWSAPGDARGEITLDDLLRMKSGLEFSEVYTDPLKDVTQMIFARGDAAAFAASKPLASPPGTSWSYSSGATNILCRVIRSAVGGSHGDYLAFPRRTIFDRIGMTNSTLEVDAAGDYVGSSFLYATARDWARFGLLYTRDGLWDRYRVLPAGWAAQCARPTPESREGEYGAHWWLKLPKDMGGRTEAARRIPDDAFFALGHEGQTLTVIPSKSLVVVRLGLSVYTDAWDQAAFLASVLDAL